GTPSLTVAGSSAASDPGRAQEPGVGPARVDAALDAAVVDAVDAPAGDEGGAQLVLRDPARAAAAALVVTKAEQVEPTAGLDDGAERRRVGRACGHLDAMEAAGIDGTIEAPDEAPELQQLFDDERHRQPAVARALERPGDGAGRGIDAAGDVAARGEEERM